MQFPANGAHLQTWITTCDRLSQVKLGSPLLRCDCKERSATTHIVWYGVVLSQRQRDKCQPFHVQLYKQYRDVQILLVRVKHKS